MGPVTTSQGQDEEEMRSDVKSAQCGAGHSVSVPSTFGGIDSSVSQAVGKEVKNPLTSDCPSRLEFLILSPKCRTVYRRSKHLTVR